MDHIQYGDGNPSEDIPHMGAVLVELNRTLYGTKFHTFCCETGRASGRHLNDIEAKIERWWPLPHG